MQWFGTKKKGVPTPTPPSTYIFFLYFFMSPATCSLLPELFYITIFTLGASASAACFASNVALRSSGVAHL